MHGEIRDTPFACYCRSSTAGRRRKLRCESRSAVSGISVDRRRILLSVGFLAGGSTVDALGVGESNRARAVKARKPVQLQQGCSQSLKDLAPLSIVREQRAIVFYRTLHIVRRMLVLALCRRSRALPVFCRVTTSHEPGGVRPQSGRLTKCRQLSPAAALLAFSSISREGSYPGTPSCLGTSVDMRALLGLGSKGLSRREERPLPILRLACPPRAHMAHPCWVDRGQVPPPRSTRFAFPAPAA